MKKSTNSRNIFLAVMQTVITGTAIFILYRYLLGTIGVSQLGIWSVVLASASAVRLSELGLSGCVVKFVAKYSARCEEVESAQVIETAAISIGVAIGVMLVVTYPLLVLALSFFIPSHSIQDAQNILPFAMISLWLMAVTGAFQSGLDGCQRVDLRSMSMIAGQLMRLFLAFLLVPHWGLIGLASGQVIQSAILLIVTWILIKCQINKLSFIPCRWSQKVFKEMLWYGINFQIISIVKMLFDPVTKALLSKFGGLSMVGYYEMANGLLMQLRGLIVSANQAVVPQIATINEIAPESLNKIYKKCYEAVLYFSVPFYAIIAGLIPIIGDLWIGHYEPIFVYSSLLLTISWFFNSLTAPAYFVYIGTGKLCWNTISHLVIGILNCGLGYTFGTLFKGWGVIIAFTISLIFGSSFSVFAYHFENQISFLSLVPKQFWVLILFSILTAGINLLAFYNFHLQLSAFFELSFMITIIVLLIGLPFWCHPMRTQLLHKFGLQKI